MIKNFLIGGIALASACSLGATCNTNTNSNVNVNNVLSNEAYSETTALSSVSGGIKDIFKSVNATAYDVNGAIRSLDYGFSTTSDGWEFAYFSPSENKFKGVNSEYFVNKDDPESTYNCDSDFKAMCDSKFPGETIIDVYNNVLDNIFIQYEVYKTEGYEHIENIYFSLRNAIKLSSLGGTRYEDFFFFNISVVNGIMRFNNSTGGAFAEPIHIHQFSNSAVNGNIYVDGSDIHYITNINNPTKFSEIISSIIATDETDGNISSSIQYTTDYPSGTDMSSVVVKAYNVDFSVKDSSNNYTTGHFTIDVLDIDAPSFANLIINSDNTKVLSKDEIISMVGITDNSESFENLTISVDETSYNNYANNYKKGGSYAVSITASDKYGNSDTQEITIRNADKIKPVFSQKNGSALNILNGELITYLSSNFGISVDYLKSLLIATDETDNNITDYIQVITDEYTGNENKANKNGYNVVFSVADNSGNTNTITLKIRVQDDLAPVVFFGNDFYISTSNPISTIELSNFLKQMYNIPESAVFVNVQSTYFTDDNASKEAIYSCCVSYLDSNSNEVANLSFNIITASQQSMQTPVEDNDDNKPSKKGNWFTRMFKSIGSFFMTIFKSIAKFFKWLFNIK